MDFNGTTTIGRRGRRAEHHQQRNTKHDHQPSATRINRDAGRLSSNRNKSSEPSPGCLSSRTSPLLG